MMEPKARAARKITSKSIDQTRPAPIIVAKCGGLSRFAEMMDLATSTVHRQMKSGIFPNPPHESGLSLHGFIISRAAENGITILATDFIESEVTEAAAA